MSSHPRGEGYIHVVVLEPQASVEKTLWCRRGWGGHSRDIRVAGVHHGDGKEAFGVVKGDNVDSMAIKKPGPSYVPPWTNASTS